MRKVDLTGQRFGRLLVIGLESRNKHRSHWKCQCDCGNEKIAEMGQLHNGHTKSCGCLRKELNTVHGKFNCSEYRSWQAMKSRCENKNTTRYVDYGGRGIKVCERWSKSFENFYIDMGNKPSKKHSIDRKNNDGNYEPDNCRWATIPEQQRNKRIRKGSRTGVNGVHIYNNGYVAAITVSGKAIYIGYFKSLLDAAEARRVAELTYWK